VGAFGRMSFEFFLMSTDRYMVTEGLADDVTLSYSAQKKNSERQEVVTKCERQN